MGRKPCFEADDWEWQALKGTIEGEGRGSIGWRGFGSGVGDFLRGTHLHADCTVTTCETHAAEMNSSSCAFRVDFCHTTDKPAQRHCLD